MSRTRAYDLAKRLFPLRPLATLVAAVMLVAACASTPTMSAYDPEIEKGVTAYHHALDSFILKMDRLGRVRDNAGRYENNQDYYDNARATLDTLVLRAEAQDVTRSCVIPDEIRTIIGEAGIALPSAAAPTAPATAATPATTTPATATPATAGDGAGGGVGCTVLMLRNARGQADTLARIHQAEGFLTGPLAVRTRDITSQALRAILAVEFAKKRNRM